MSNETNIKVQSTLPYMQMLNVIVSGRVDLMEKIINNPTKFMVTQFQVDILIDHLKSQRVKVMDNETNTNEVSQRDWIYSRKYSNLFFDKIVEKDFINMDFDNFMKDYNFIITMYLVVNIPLPVEYDTEIVYFNVATLQDFINFEPTVFINELNEMLAIIVYNLVHNTNYKGNKAWVTNQTSQFKQEKSGKNKR